VLQDIEKKSQPAGWLFFGLLGRMKEIAYSAQNGIKRADERFQSVSSVSEQRL
jgi:hypothetical protein